MVKGHTNENTELVPGNAGRGQRADFNWEVRHTGIRAEALGENEMPGRGNLDTFFF